ncbi:YjeF, variant [Saprolegnia diclina VS20]|uniref:ATP-dependent (S)-NAD(P)H-hydrate dehydratase n=1 Tax=Saprolegnia diclina (strain VS20) TaxID=1156394 RepID=T0QVE7_SAPDV|nr:YjeF, variant [Saprolegnia diclina VS20]EQC42199.1 YjeF, variant [Saprolegnia diclina VS20]|eukprot:XP_008604767.1 YjeF, variant [Saprolegnia diclina VS20]
MTQQLVASIRQAIPALSKDLHKGQYGKVAIVGGSLEYTGAPYYAAISALKTGVDLCHVICSAEAAIPIKCYSPELIVHPLLTHAPDAIERIAAVLPRIDAIVIGPGLGREPFVLDLVKNVVGVAKARDMPIVLDGDALYMLAADTTLIAGYRHAVLTPNIVEYGRLCVATGLLKELNLVLAALIPPSQLSQKLGQVAILRKGEVDLASDGVSTFTNTLEGSPRRCGGQGDVHHRHAERALDGVV